MPGLLREPQITLPASNLGPSNQSFMPLTREKDLVDLKQSWSWHFLTLWPSLPWSTITWLLLRPLVSSLTTVPSWAPCSHNLQHTTPSHTSTTFLPCSLCHPSIVHQTSIFLFKPFSDINSSVVSQAPFYIPHPHGCLNWSCIFLPCFWILCACLSFVHIFGLFCEVLSFSWAGIMTDFILKPPS